MIEKYIDKKDKKKIMEFINKTIIDSDDTKGFIGINNYGIVITGSGDAILTLTTLLIKHLHEEAQIDKEHIECAVKLAFMDHKEIEKETFKKIKEMLEEISKAIKEGEDNE